MTLLSKKEESVVKKTSKIGRERILLDNVCVCGKTYRPPSSKTKFCGNECARANRPLKGVTLKCLCGTEFYIRQSSLRETNYCSRECAKSKPSTKLVLNCKHCGVQYTTYRSHMKHRGSSFCSRACNGKDQTLNRSGPNSATWMGGLSKENHRIRQSQAFKNWRKAVFERDNYTCVGCGQHGGYLEPDHIKPFAYFKELRFELSNGRTMCKPCHKLTDTYGHKARKMYEQIEN